MNRRYLFKKGVTLIELIVALALFAILIPIIHSVFSVGSKSYVLSKDSGFAQQEVRLTSDVLNSELRYISNLKSSPLSGEYFSLEIKENDDGTFYLEKREYNDSNVDGINLKRLYGNFSEIRFDNSISKGVIKVTLSKTEGTQEYDLEFDIALENNRNLSWPTTISSESENRILYYNLPTSTSIGESNPPDIEDNEDEDIADDILPTGITYIKKTENENTNGKEKTYIVDITVEFNDNTFFTHTDIPVTFIRNNKNVPYPEFVKATVSGVSASGFKYTKSINVYN